MTAKRAAKPARTFGTGPPAHLLSQFVPYRRTSGTAVNVHQAAAILGIGAEQVRRHLRAGRIVGVKHTRVGWVISRESVEGWRKLRQSARHTPPP